MDLPNWSKRVRENSWLLSGFIFVIAAALWYFAIVPIITIRIPAHWSQSFIFIGISTTVDPTTGEFFKVDGTSLYQRTFVVAEKNGNVATMRDRYTIRDVVADKIIYDYTYRAEVNARTGEHLAEQYRGDYYLFPRQVERKTYRIRNSYIKGVPLQFVKEVAVEGVETYLFSYIGPGEYTDSYVGMQDAEGRQVEDGIEVRCSDDQFRLSMWVEPLTGELVKFDESCYSGDYAYDVATNTRLFPVLRWGAMTAGDDVQRQSGQVLQQRVNYIWAVLYWPVALLGIGLCLIWVHFYFRWRQS